MKKIIYHNNWNYKNKNILIILAISSATCVLYIIIIDLARIKKVFFLFNLKRAENNKKKTRKKIIYHSNEFYLDFVI